MGWNVCFVPIADIRVCSRNECRQVLGFFCHKIIECYARLVSLSTHGLTDILENGVDFLVALAQSELLLAKILAHAFQLFRIGT